MSSIGTEKTDNLTIFGWTLSRTEPTRLWDKRDPSMAQIEIIPEMHRPLSVKLRSITKFPILSRLSLGGVGFYSGTNVLRGA